MRNNSMLFLSGFLVAILLPSFSISIGLGDPTHHPENGVIKPATFQYLTYMETSKISLCAGHCSYVEQIKPIGILETNFQSRIYHKIHNV